MTHTIKPVVHCQKVSFSWNRESLLREIDFSIFPGDFAVIIGGNGTGKSTLMRLILGEVRPDKGQILLFDQLVDQMSQWTQVGYLPQNATEQNASFPASAYELVEAHCLNRCRKQKLSRQERKKRVIQALQQVGLDQEVDSPISQLSGGQQQRVLIASVLAAEPSLLILDEPTAGIDYENTQILYHLLSHLQKDCGMTLLMITHETEHIQEFANRVFCLEGGSLLELSPEQIDQELNHRHHHHHSGEENCSSSQSCLWKGCPLRQEKE